MAEDLIKQRAKVVFDYAAAVQQEFHPNAFPAHVTPLKPFQESQVTASNLSQAKSNYFGFIVGNANARVISVEDVDDWLRLVFERHGILSSFLKEKSATDKLLGLNNPFVFFEEAEGSIVYQASAKGDVYGITSHLAKPFWDARTPTNFRKHLKQISLASSELQNQLVYPRIVAFLGELIASNALKIGDGFTKETFARKFGDIFEDAITSDYMAMVYRPVAAEFAKTGGDLFSIAEFETARKGINLGNLRSYLDRADTKIESVSRAFGFAEKVPHGTFVTYGYPGEGREPQDKNFMVVNVSDGSPVKSEKTKSLEKTKSQKDRDVPSASGSKRKFESREGNHEERTMGSARKKWKDQDGASRAVPAEFDKSKSLWSALAVPPGYEVKNGPKRPCNYCKGEHYDFQCPDNKRGSS